MTRDFSRGAYVVLAIIASHVEAWVNRLNYLLTPKPRRHNGYERRRNPRACVLCHGPMRPDRRPPRIERTKDGKIRNISGDVLEWHRCARCHGSQIGIPRRAA